ncbi:MAG: ABC transporter substrate-binding protein [Candidatus Alcyoniella australis]|nr:ABC transporter substrate-binding protein [Candidatus Alcyoniella australis]
MRRIHWAIAISILALICICAGCGGSKLEQQPVLSAVVVGIEGTPTNLDPRFATDAYSTRIIPLIAPGLVSMDPRGLPRPELAQSWEIAPDGLSYTFQLRSGLRFSDGSELTAVDVVANFRSVLDPATGSPAVSGLFALKSVEAQGDLIVRFELDQPFAPFLLKCFRGILPAELLADPAMSQRPLGAGPYRIARNERGQRIVLERNEQYYGPQPTIERITFRILENQTTRTLELEAGGLDLVQNAVAPGDLARFEADPRFVVLREPGVNYSYLGFNLEDPLLQKLEVRQAISMAIDRRAIIDSSLEGMARPATGLLAPSNWAYEPDVPTFGYDPQRARELLDAAGLIDPDGDGEQPRFELTYKTSTDRLRNEIATIIAYQLGQVGIKVEKRSYEWGTFFADVKNGNFQLYSLTWVGITDPDIYHYVFHSDSLPPSGANRGRYRNPRLDGLIDASRVELDREKRKRIFEDVQRTLAADCVYVSLWYSDNVVVHSRGLHGFAIYPGGEYTSLATATLEP